MNVLIMAMMLVGADVRVSLTPDQPLPFAYVDEPLILELVAETTAEAAVTMAIEGRHGSPVSIDLGPFHLDENEALWSPIETVAQLRDAYLARYIITLDGKPVQGEQWFCRIDRPIPGYSFPICANAKGVYAPGLLPAMNAIPGRSIRIPADLPDIETRVQEVQAAGLSVVVCVSLARLENPASHVERLAELLGDRVARWDIEPGDTPSAVAPVVEALRRGPSRAALGLVIPGAEGLDALVKAGLGNHAWTLVLAKEAPNEADLTGLRTSSERSGLEGLALVALNTGGDADMVDSGRRILRNAAVGAETIVDVSEVYDGTRFGEDYVYLCGLAHRLQGATAVGELDLGTGVNASVLRNGSGWIVALWTEDAPRQVSLRLGNAGDLAFTDARNNPLPTPPRNGDTLVMRVEREPLFLSGNGGSLLADAARHMARREARFLLQPKDAEKVLPAEAVEMLKAFARDGGGSRRSFLTLLSMFPRLEEQHHAGILSTDVAIPLLAGLGRLARHLCMVEQERGEPFLDPLQKTLADCAEYTSRYLTGSTGPSNGYTRQDWLLTEVTRLTADAKRLHSEGRTTEADAVAAFAEARAQSLPFAAGAPRN